MGKCARENGSDAGVAVNQRCEILIGRFAAHVALLIINWFLSRSRRPAVARKDRQVVSDTGGSQSPEIQPAPEKWNQIN